MRPWARWAILGATAVVLVVLFAVLRPSAGEDPSPTPTPGSPTGSPSPSPSPTASPTESPEPDRTLIEVTYRNGAVQGPTRFEVTLGDGVRLVVRADVSDHVHLHGYDLMADVGPGRPARIDFRADAPGVYEVELEDSGVPLIELEIAP